MQLHSFGLRVLPSWVVHCWLHAKPQGVFGSWRHPWVEFCSAALRGLVWPIQHISSNVIWGKKNQGLPSAPLQDLGAHGHSPMLGCWRMDLVLPCCWWWGSFQSQASFQSFAVIALMLVQTSGASGCCCSYTLSTLRHKNSLSSSSEESQASAIQSSA